MFETKQQRGAALAVVGVLLALIWSALGWAGSHFVEDEVTAAAQELEAAFDRFESVADTQLAMAVGDLDLPAGSSFRFVGNLQAVVAQEVQVLAEVRCLRVTASAPDVDSPLRVDETLVSRRSCGS